MRIPIPHCERVRVLNAAAPRDPASPAALALLDEVTPYSRQAKLEERNLDGYYLKNKLTDLCGN